MRISSLGLIRVFTFVFCLAVFAAMQMACGTGSGGTITNSSSDSSGSSTGTSAQHSITITWSDPAAASSNVFRSTVSGGPYGYIGATTYMEFVDANVAGGGRYCYVITAVEDGVESAYSQESCATVPST